MITAKSIIDLCEAVELIDFRKDKSKPEFKAGFNGKYVVIRGIGDNLDRDQMTKDKRVDHNLLNKIFVNTQKKTFKFDREDTSLYLASGSKKEFKDVEYQTSEFKTVYKLLKELEKFGTITSSSSYTLESSDRPEELVKFLRKDNLYHGTGGSNVKRILKVGLRPSVDAIGSKMRGNGATIKGWTQNFVYLTPSFDYAQTYAKINSKPQVVFAVQVPDPNKLFIDDDSLRPMLITKLHKEIEAVTSNDKNPWSKADYNWKFTSNILQYDIADNLLPIYLGQSIADLSSKVPGYLDLMRKHEELPSEKEFLSFLYWIDQKVKIIYRKILNTNWKRMAYSDSYGSSNAVGYKGNIPPKFLQIVWRSK